MNQSNWVELLDLITENADICVRKCRYLKSSSCFLVCIICLEVYFWQHGSSKFELLWK